MSKPLPLPPNFNPETFMLARQEEGRTYHAPRLAAEFANDLLANGTREDVDLAEKVLDAMLACQETREGIPIWGIFSGSARTRWWKISMRSNFVFSSLFL